jgi:hypothetical protein
MFHEHLRKAPVRVDVVLEGPCGGVTMREYLSGKEVLINIAGALELVVLFGKNL